mgnify:FL=1
MENRASEARKVTIIGFFVNLVLTAAKITAGIIGKSSAMIADGVHSLSDFATDIVVLAFVKVSGKDSDDNHKYGHGKFETFATLIISLALAGVGIGIFINGLEKIIEYLKGGEIEQPGMVALWAAIISITSKEILFRYTNVVGKRINSPAVIANGWHHRSDAFSSIGTALGISGAIFLGDSWRILDPIAGIVVSFFILKVAYDLGMPSIKELLEASLPDETIVEIEKIITGHPEVIKFHHLKTRKVGTVYAIDVHIKLDKQISFIKSHDIATDIENSIRERYGRGTHINIHTEPL